MKTNHLTMKRMSKKDILIFLIGLAFCAYPIISNYIVYRNQNEAISSYESQINQITEYEIKEKNKQAKKWNEELYYTQKGLSNYDASQYDNILNITNGIMGSIEIPNIDVNLPIYHGTSNEILSIGVGHLSDTSLPIGGDNTHCVLTGHRGLPSSKLFTRLDELKIGDLFYIYVFNEIHAYKIDTIVTVDPEEITGFDIEDGKDLVSLVTCTPYGINTHRLIITGHRVEYVTTEKESIKKKMPSIREILFFMIPIGFLFIAIICFLERRKSNE